MTHRVLSGSSQSGLDKGYFCKKAPTKQPLASTPCVERKESCALLSILWIMDSYFLPTRTQYYMWADSGKAIQKIAFLAH